MLTLQIGDAAPSFTSTNQSGEQVSLSDYAGRKLVLYFYPKDDTPGCTAEACSLRDGFEDLRAAGYDILGVSPDSEKKHQKFIAKYSLQFPLLADEDHSIALAYGVWGPKKFMGREYQGIHRTTFVIDAQGKLEQIITKVNNEKAAAQILFE
ncbi:MAG: thioredoxin-dependent thiol peroxidase [Saprospiraceae bacterium]